MLPEGSHQQKVLQFIEDKLQSMQVRDPKKKSGEKDDDDDVHLAFFYLGYRIKNKAHAIAHQNNNEMEFQEQYQLMIDKKKEKAANEMITGVVGKLINTVKKKQVMV